MNTLLLSILIPLTPDRIECADRLEHEFWQQAKDLLPHIEVIREIDNREMTIGEKRNILYAKANGAYSVQWDSDDFIHPQGLELIIGAILRQDYDCCTYEEHIDFDGKIQRSNHSLKYDDWQDNFDGFDFVRTPFMKSVIKTEIARSVPVPHIRYAEDHLWAQALKPHLKTEIHLNEQIYRYIHRKTPHNERYGIEQTS